MMTKSKLSIFLVIFFAAFVPVKVFGFSASDITTHTVPESYFYKQEFDKLILDATIPSGNAGTGDVLHAFTIKTGGTVKRNEDFTKIVLWSDAGELGFQGMAIDQKLGEMEYVYGLTTWRVKDLNVEIPETGLRIFVSVETKKDLTYGRFFKAQIPGLLDQNYNGLYDAEDLGIFLQSCNNGPTDSPLTNFYGQFVRVFPSGLETLPPKAVITNLETGSSFTATTSLEIKGLARDQGGSSMQWVKIGIKPENGVEAWYQAELGEWSGDEQNWSYLWQNIQPGIYALRLQSIDGRGNSGISEQEITITIISELEPEPIPEPEPTPEPEPEPEPEPTPEPGEPTEQEQIVSLQEQIAEIQQLIINLLNQLLDLLRAQLGL